MSNPSSPQISLLLFPPNTAIVLSPDYMIPNLSVAHVRIGRGIFIFKRTVFK